MTVFSLPFARGVGILNAMKPDQHSGFGRRRGSSLRVVATVGIVLASSIVGCAIKPDPEFPAPIAPLSPEARVAVAVAPVVNASPSAEVAQWTFATRRLLIELLERSQRFTVVDMADPRATATVELVFRDVKDEPWLVSVVYGAEQEQNRKRRAMVEVEWRTLATSGAVTGGGNLVSHQFREGADPIEMPTVDHLESGSFWESPFGAATRANLDLVVRRLSERG